MPRTAASIVFTGCQAAKGPGMTATFGGQFLNDILEELYIKRNLMVNRVTQPIVVAPNSTGPFPLEADYQRTYDLFYQIPASGGATASTITQFLVKITMEQWDAEFKSPSISNYPYEFASDLSSQAQVWSGGSPGNGNLTSAGNIFIYPQSSGQLILTHRYMKKQPDIANPDTSTVIPWFEDQTYLIKELSSRMATITGDDRQAQWHSEAEEILRPYLIQEGDEQPAVQMMKLDPRHFHFSRALRPTKAMPFTIAWLFMASASMFFAASPLTHFLA